VNGKNFEGIGRDLIEVISRNLIGETEENRERTSIILPSVLAKIQDEEKYKAFTAAHTELVVAKVIHLI
jgi:hypothetical protein